MYQGGIVLKFLGIDGGGTKTEFLLADGNGNILGHTIKGTCHYKQTSFENFECIIRNGISSVCEDANINIGDISYACLGIPGYGEIQNDIVIIDNILKNIFNTVPFVSVNDSVVGWAGSLAGNAGVNIIAGTGSIAFGCNENGDFSRAGGWGYFCGDEGSAYWIGKKLIEIFAKQSDGRLEKTNIYQIVKNKYELENDFDIIKIILDDMSAERSQIAQIAQLVYDGAKVKDEACLNIYKEAAYEHFLTIKAVMEKLEFDKNKTLLVSYSGGVFKSEDFILKPLNDLLKNYCQSIELMKPEFNPAEGAVIYAVKKSLEIENLEIWIENFKLKNSLLNNTTI